MRWSKVRGTVESGIWVRKGDARDRMLPANLEHLSVEWRKRGSYDTVWVTPGHDCLFHTLMDVEQRSGHKLITPSGMGDWFVV